MSSEGRVPTHSTCVGCKPKKLGYSLTVGILDPVHRGPLDLFRLGDVLLNMTQICKPIAEQYRGGRDSLRLEYRQFVRGLAQRRRDLGLCQLDLDPVLGVAEGYIAKLEAFHRIPSTLRMFEWLQGLGVAIALRPVPLPPATLHAIEVSQARRDEDKHK